MKRIAIALVLACCASYGLAKTDLHSQGDEKAWELTVEDWLKRNKWKGLEEAIPTLLEQKERKEHEEPFKEDEYYNIVMWLHHCYTQLGDFASTQKLLSSALHVYNRKGGNPNSKYTRSLWMCKGMLEFSLKNYGDALRYYNEAQCLFEEANEYGEDYVVMLSNMASAYQANGDALSAKMYIDEAKEQFERLHGSIFSAPGEERFKMLLSYGNVCDLVGHKAEAEKCFRHIVERCKKTLFSQDTYTLARNNLAALYMKQNRWAEAAKLLDKLEGENDEDDYLLAQNKALCQIYLGNHRKCMASLASMNNCALRNIDALFSQFAGLERENYWQVVSRELIFMNNLIACHTNTPEAISTAYNNFLFCKTLLANSSRMLDHAATQSADTAMSELHSRYSELKGRLAYKTNSTAERDSIAREIINVERAMLSSIGNLGQRLLDGANTWKDIKAALDDGEVAIEYCHVPRMEQYPDMKPYYGAFVLRKDYNHPLLVTLENVDSVEAVFGNAESSELLVNELYASNKSTLLYSMLWRKLLPYLNGVKKVYYSPTGYLANLNFDVLRDKAGVMLNERYAMCRVSSTASIGDAKASASYRSAALYGNIKYDESMETMAEMSAAYDEYSGTAIGQELALRPESERGSWGAIPSTKGEIEGIRKLLRGKGIAVSLFDGIAANEESFKNLHRRSPDIVHLATHGFVIDTQKKANGNKFVGTTTIFSPKDAYLMWAGLMLAGGNNAWQGKFNLTNVEDGILTADEISRLDLSGVKLAVLSACETARGKVDPVDGVYGLQRAFKLAGVKTIVMSLWKVQDDATAMLMTRFYTYLTNGAEKHQALWNAMMDVRKKYKDPYYWASFVMLD